MMWDSLAAPLRGMVSYLLLAMVALLAGCSGGAGPGANDSPSTPGPGPSAAQPSVTLSAMPASVTAGSSTTLSWTSTNATACTASGGWSGPRGISGSETITALNQNTGFTLSCTGAGGTGQSSRQVSVTSAPAVTAPLLTFSAAMGEVGVNSTVLLNWSTTNATSCTASDGWSGVRPTSGTETVGPLATSSAFTLTCAGAVGPPAQRTATIVVSGQSTSGGLNGAVDSSMIDLSGSNQVYVFRGMVTPRDTQGNANDAAFKLPVVQDANACTFSYLLPSLEQGTYTLAFTSQAQLDRPTQADTLTFIGTTAVMVGGQAVRRDFRPASVLQVGPGKQFVTIAAAAAAAAANPGSVIEVDAAGTYTDDIVVWRDNDVVVRGINGRPLVRGTQVIGFSPSDDRRNGKGLFVVAADRMRLENLEISGARVQDQNGAAVRNEGRDLTICNSVMRDSENGFLGGAFGTLTIEYSTFDNNGFGDGQTHNFYVDAGSAVGDRLIFRHNYSHRARIGHNLKTRARENFILFNRIMDEADGTASYAIDVSDGGLSYIVGNLLQQGPNTDNNDIVAFNLEAIDPARPQELYLVNNTFVNDLGRGAFLNVRGSTAIFRSVNNLFIGGGTLYTGKQPQVTTNLQAPASVVVSTIGFDYRLNLGVAPINVGTEPGSVAGVSLLPDFQYVHPARRERRVASGTIDVGAYEAAP
jgi:hypothetical protein